MNELHAQIEHSSRSFFRVDSYIYRFADLSVIYNISFGGNMDGALSPLAGKSTAGR